MNLLDLNIEYLMLGIIITYIPFHFFEEALGDFLTWMKEHKWILEKITYGHWMANNVFFYFPLRILGITIFHFSKYKLLFTGVGIIIWGLIHCIDHIVYTMKDHKISPGIFTGLVFGTISVLALISYIIKIN